MADKKSDSKIMSMLERKGIIRKAGDGSSDGANEAPPVYDPNIKPIFDDAINVKPAARQPIPGMTTPIFPSEEVDIDETVIVESEPAPFAPPPAQPAPEPYFETQQPASAQAAYTDSADQSRSSSMFSSLNPFRNGSTPADEYQAVSANGGAVPAQAENYTDRYLNINELYDALALRSKKTETVYLIEEYLQTLPDSLPDSQRREIVGKIINASGFDYDLLMGDGVLRVKMLKEYAERFARHTDDYIAARQAEIDEMEQRILRTRRLIDNRKELHKKQFFTIEAEAQRLKEILTFISG
ncbi:MAG: hypothetical protein LBC73_00865 [Oscillospiraceae bacterium]|jgi:hypothetical protein|nr:hypothetical protein [Oscillospiraceae bacterium]